MGPHREDLMAYQRQAHDFFMPEKMREDLQRKADASLQLMPSMYILVQKITRLTIPDSQLPSLDTYHSLVALDTNHHKSTTAFGYPSWLYKATSSKNGYLYCLRRLEGMVSHREVIFRN
jgi:PAB-dependent poly(A)-specific ribonuclease subunit 3